MDRLIANAWLPKSLSWGTSEDEILNYIGIHDPGCKWDPERVVRMSHIDLARGDKRLLIQTVFPAALMNDEEVVKQLRFYVRCNESWANLPDEVVDVRKWKNPLTEFPNLDKYMGYERTKEQKEENARLVPGPMKPADHPSRQPPSKPNSKKKRAASHGFKDLDDSI
ncbi:hypothetical protein NUU61_009480 [Penicillium alfredii]|uniref:Uncharacterized protein n=1 Tax=Penicillium alfredii TaxID=1506179 RepID=A0A9W9JXE5_9EURO|nr:uncharacterized protein NUU61_009480 [Penicillium alfredii]KAJ5084901.1 hypothetical protein NUU61_009480 [Penicillium alfredii]